MWGIQHFCRKIYKLRTPRAIPSVGKQHKGQKQSFHTEMVWYDVFENRKTMAL